MLALKRIVISKTPVSEVEGYNADMGI